MAVASVVLIALVLARTLAGGNAIGADVELWVRVEPDGYTYRCGNGIPDDASVRRCFDGAFSVTPPIGPVRMFVYRCFAGLGCKFDSPGVRFVPTGESREDASRRWDVYRQVADD